MMKLNEQNVLFFARTMELGGTENVVLQLCEIFQEEVNKIVVCSCGGVNVAKLDAMGVKHYTISDIEQKNPITILKTAVTIKKIIKEENISIIHTHHRMAAFYVTLLRAYRRCVFINTSHNTFDSRPLLTKFAYKHANIIACGEMVKKNLVEFFDLNNKQVTVIHNAVKPFCNEVIDVTKIKNLRDEGYFLIGNVGRLSEQKGMRYFIDAVPKILNRFPMTRFIIIGTGELEEQLRKQVLSEHLEGEIIFLGYRPDIQNVMKQLDLLVLSSLWEGFPLTPIEAFSVGKTVVATGVDGTLEIVQNEQNGLLVDARNSDQIYEAVCRFIENEELRKKCENEAYESFLKDYSFDKFSDMHIKYYRSLVEK